MHWMSVYIWLIFFVYVGNTMFYFSNKVKMIHLLFSFILVYLSSFTPLSSALTEIKALAEEEMCCF